MIQRIPPGAGIEQTTALDMDQRCEPHWNSECNKKKKKKTKNNKNNTTSSNNNNNVDISTIGTHHTQVDSSS